MTTILNKLKIPGLLVLLIAGFFFAQPLSAQPGVSVPVDAFYNELAPYGQWTQYPGYGNAWIPNAGPDFQPYTTNGHWVMTEYGNTWVSDYDWGWAPFHYGRWIYDPAYGGWLWLPDTEWAPAWVSWRSGGGYYGWAPLGPGVTVNINIPAPYWTFVPQVYITSPNLYGYCVPRNRVVNIYQNTTYINNVYRYNNRSFNYGPPRGDIERVTRRNVDVYRVESINRPGRSVIGNGSVGFYRPGSNGRGQAYGQGYNNRNDGYDNTGRPDYSRNNGSSRGDYNGNNGYNGNSTPNRGYNGNRNATPNGGYTGSTTPNRDYTPSTGRPYDGNVNRDNTPAPSRSYDGNTNRDYTPAPSRTNDGSATGRGSYGNNAPADRNGSYGTTPTPVPDNTPSNRFERNRGSYSPGNAQQAPIPSPQSNRAFDRSERQGPMNMPSAPGGRNGGDIQRTPEVRSAPNQQPAQGQSQPGGGEGRQRGPR